MASAPTRFCKESSHMTINDAFSKLHYAVQRLGAVDDNAKAGKVLQELMQEFLLTKNWTLLLPERGYRLHTNYPHYRINYLVIKNRVIRRRLNSVINCTHGIIYDISNNQLPRFLPDSHTDPLYDATYDHLLDDIGRSLAIIPFSDPQQNYLAGILICQYHFFDDSQEEVVREFLQAFSEVISQTYWRIEVITALQRDASTDPLTGLYNRRTFVKTAEREIIESNRYKRIISLIIIDIDNFKHINDSQGHLMGDQVLVHCSQLLINSVRSLDYVFRFAGDEFLVLMPDTDRKSLERVARRIEDNLKKNRMNPASTSYTISIGKYSGVPQNLIDMFNRADSNLYAQKHRSALVTSHALQEEVSKSL